MTGKMSSPLPDGHNRSTDATSHAIWGCQEVDLNVAVLRRIIDVLEGRTHANPPGTPGHNGDIPNRGR
jgi:hypothetical protein